MPDEVAMDEQQLEYLRNQDWDEISAKVLAAAFVFAARYGWTRASSLPEGQSIEDLVLEAIHDLFMDPGRISENCALTAQLKGMVRSKLWNLARCADRKTKRTSTLDETQLCRGNPGTERVQVVDQFDRAIELLAEHPKVKEKEDLELLVMAYGMGVADPESLEKETGLPRARIYQLSRELRGLYPAVKQQLIEGGRAS